MIYYDFKVGLNVQQSFEEQLAFGDESPSRTTVFDCYSEFIFGNEERVGGPCS